MGKSVLRSTGSGDQKIMGKMCCEVIVPEFR